MSPADGLLSWLSLIFSTGMHETRAIWLFGIPAVALLAASISGFFAIAHRGWRRDWDEYIELLFMGSWILSGGTYLGAMAFVFESSKVWASAPDAAGAFVLNWIVGFMVSMFAGGMVGGASAAIGFYGGAIPGVMGAFLLDKCLLLRAKLSSISGMPS